MSRKYEFLSHPSSENARFQLGSKIQFALETPEETPLVDDEASARKKNKKSTVREQGGSLTIDLGEGGEGGGGAWASSGTNEVSILWDGSVARETLRVLYLDRELAILEHEQDGCAPWVLASVP